MNLRDDLQRLGAGAGEIEAAEKYLAAREARRLERRAVWAREMGDVLQAAFDAPVPRVPR